MTDDAVLARLDRLESENTRLAEEGNHVTARLADLEAENRALRQEASAPTVPAAPPPAPGPPEVGAVGRRHLIGKGLAAVGAAAAGAILLDGKPTAAAVGDPVRIGYTNTGSDTEIEAPIPGSISALRLSGTPLYALWATTSSSTGYGILVGSKYAHLRLAPPTNRTPPVFDTTGHSSGELLTDDQANLWYCTGSGTPGTWRTLSGPGCVGSFYPWPAPVRAYDSRPGTQPSVGPKTKLVAGVSRTIDLNAASTVNAGTRGVLVQVLLVNAASGNGNFTIWSDDRPKPQANTLVWGGSGGRWSTLAFTNVAAGRVTLSASLATDVVLDVVGIYG